MPHSAADGTVLYREPDPRHAAEHTLRACGSCSSRRCIRAPTRPISARSSRRSSARSRERGHEVERAVLDTRAGGKLRYLELARRTLRAARPDVVYAHFLVPSGLIAALAGRAPLVVTAHGRDVRNIGELPGIAAATRLVVRRAATVVCVSEYLRASSRRRCRRRAARRRSSRAASTSSGSRSRRRRTGRRASSASARSRSARTSSGSPTRSRGSARGR